MKPNEQAEEFADKSWTRGSERWLACCADFLAGFAAGEAAGIKLACESLEHLVAISHMHPWTCQDLIRVIRNNYTIRASGEQK